MVYLGHNYLCHVHELLANAADLTQALLQGKNYTHKHNELCQQLSSVADPGCLSRIPDPWSWFLPIPDPGSKKKQQQKRVVKKNLLSYVATNFTKLKIILVWSAEEKNWQIFKELQIFLPKKLSLSYIKYGFGIRDPRSGIRKKPIPDPGSRGQKGTGSRIRIRNTAIVSEFFPGRTNFWSLRNLLKRVY